MSPTVTPPPADLVDRLSQHRTIGSVPRAELEWVAEHGEFRHVNAGEIVGHKGELLEGMVVMLTGRVEAALDRGTGRRFTLSSEGGEITAQLPYSRAREAQFDIVAVEAADIVLIRRELFPDLIRDCPTIVEIAVHVMLERARLMTSASAADDKMMSMGRLSAGLAHELNNPASAASRSAKQLGGALTTAEHAAEALGALQLSERQRRRLEDVASGALMPTATGVFSAIERADHEEDIADWLDSRGADATLADTLAESGVSRDSLDALADEFDGTELDVALRWIGAVYIARTLAAEVERATTRIHDLVSAVKRFTYMDRASTPEPTDIAQGINDTVMVLSTKAKSKAIAIRVDMPPHLPKIVANAGELNQVWANLIENAIDALQEGGEVRVIARVDDREVVVCVVDNGPGVPFELQQRIFEPFFTTKPIGQGTGLGLDIALRTVRRFGGLIALDSKPGRTEFRVALPVSAPSENTNAGPKP
ncbi:MAG TPA: ATP-binding protein [Gemmatimonadaceae bacterium]|nr:ATP-binding protein [Gemmatimonadaceae bacterium]